MRFRLTSFHKKSAFSATAHSENSESGRLSYFIQFFVWFHIVCDRYASDHAHFTFFNLIWPLSLSWVFEIQTNGYTEKLSYVMLSSAFPGMLCISLHITCSKFCHQHFKIQKRFSYTKTCSAFHGELCIFILFFPQPVETKLLFSKTFYVCSLFLVRDEGTIILQIWRRKMYLITNIKVLRKRIQSDLYFFSSYHQFYLHAKMKSKVEEIFKNLNK